MQEFFQNKYVNLSTRIWFFSKKTPIMPNYKVSLFKLNCNKCKCMQTRICFYKNTISHFAHYFFYIVKNPRWCSKYRSFASSSIYNNFPRVVARQEEESRCVVPVCVPQKKTIRYNRSSNGGTRRRTTEDSMSSAPHDRHGRTALNRARREKGGVANLNFPSRQPPCHRFSAFAGINGHVTAGLLAIRAR